MLVFVLLFSSFISFLKLELLERLCLEIMCQKSRTSVVLIYESAQGFLSW